MLSIARRSALVAASLAATSLAQKVPDIRMDVGDAPGQGVSMWAHVAASGTSAYAVWSDTRNGNADIYGNVSHDTGRTWLSDAIRLDLGDAPGAAHSGKPRVTTEGDTVYVVWVDRRNGQGDVYFNRSTDEGTTWLTDPVRLDLGSPPGAALVDVPVVAALGDAVYVVWEDGRNGANLDIYLNRSLDRGVTWMATDVRLDTNAPGGGHSVDPHIAVTPDGVYVDWEDWRHPAVSAYFNRSLDQGLTWLASDVRLDTNDPAIGGSFDPEITAVGPHVYASWYDDRNDFAGPELKKDIYGNVSHDAGATWLAQDVRLDVGDLPGQSNSIKPHMTSFGSHVIVAWSDMRNDTDGVPPAGADVFVNVSSDHGSTWLTAPIRLDTGDAPGAANSGPAYITSNGANVYVAYEDNRDGEVDIYVNRSPDLGQTWLAADVRLDTGTPPGASDSFVPRLAATDTDVHVVWWDRRNGANFDIYFNKPFAIESYGSAKPGSGGIAPALALDAGGPPTIGSTATLSVSGGLGGSPAGVFAASGPASVPLFEGEWLLGALVFPGPAFFVPLSGPVGQAGAGVGSKSFAIPGDPSLVGLRLCFQALILDGGVSPSPISMTNAIELWIG